MRHPRSRVLAGVSALAVAAMVAPGAQADPAGSAAADPVASAAARAGDDRPDELVEAQRTATQEAVAAVVSGNATPVTKGGGKSVQGAPRQWVQ